MNTPWDAQQREWLQAMGFEVMVPNAAPAVPDDAVPGAGHGRRAQATGEASAGSAAGVWRDGPLLRALLRAARTRDAQAVADLLPPPDALRGNAAAKRSLWPKLRALRRARRH